MNNVVVCETCPSLVHCHFCQLDSIHPNNVNNKINFIYCKVILIIIKPMMSSFFILYQSINHLFGVQ